MIMMIDENNEFSGYIGSCIDVTEKIEGANLKKMAQIDNLTGVFNRQYFHSIVKEELDKANRFKNEFCIVMIDLDSFKQINDTYGHLVGDKVLKLFANSCKKSIRKFDILGRFGGDEFIVFMPQTSLENAKITFDRLNIFLSEPVKINKQLSIRISFSYGITSSTGNESLDKILIRADHNMYEMKSKNKHNLNSNSISR